LLAWQLAVNAESGSDLGMASGAWVVVFWFLVAVIPEGRRVGRKINRLAGWKDEIWRGLFMCPELDAGTRSGELMGPRLLSYAEKPGQIP
jgi:hypothetical protein